MSAPEIVTDDMLYKETKSNIFDAFKKYGKVKSLQKNLDLCSSFQAPDFYIKALQTDGNVERLSDNYIIKVDDIAGINLKDFEKEFRNKGLHIYNLETNQDNTSNTKGTLHFKIRENENKDKLNRIKVNLANSGLNIDNYRSTAIRPK
jgi:hypothetical protein